MIFKHLTALLLITFTLTCLSQSKVIESDLVERLNYGVVYHWNHKQLNSIERWEHSFVIPLDSIIYPVRQPTPSYCDKKKSKLGMCKTYSSTFDTIDKLQNSIFTGLKDHQLSLIDALQLEESKGSPADESTMMPSQSTQHPNIPPCPADWLQVDTSCMLKVGNALSYQDASTFCLREGALLASIKDSKVNDILLAMHKEDEDGIWIGLNDIMKEGNFQWENSIPVKYTNWKKNEPNDKGHAEDCGEQLMDGTWNDSPCTSKKMFICETPAAMNSSQIPPRNKRDPALGFIGELSSTIFGTVSYKDMKRFRNQVLEVEQAESDRTDTLFSYEQDLYSHQTVLQKEVNEEMKGEKALDKMVGVEMRKLEVINNFVNTESNIVANISMDLGQVRTKFTPNFMFHKFYNSQSLSHTLLVRNIHYLRFRYIL